MSYGIIVLFKISKYNCTCFSSSMVEQVFSVTYVDVYCKIKKIPMIISSKQLYIAKYCFT